jgi:ubiquinone/menaquinone biosynthesis C-methylase UbiE
VSSAAAGDRDHYSYAVYADPAMAEQFDALRFSGPIGTLIAEDQERVLADFLGDVRGLQVLDVGTGTGRAALSLASRGARVRGIDASSHMLAVARRRADAAALDIEFTTGDAHDLPFADRSMDAAVSLRVLMHAPGWERCLAELCRVTRSRIVVDFPAAVSIAAAQPVLRRARSRLRRREDDRAGQQGTPRTDLEAYRVFTLRRVREALAANGFAVRRVHRQFALPIALHKAIGARAFTRGVEGMLRAVGLVRLFGSPVTVLAERAE